MGYTHKNSWVGLSYIALQKLKEHLNSTISAILGLEGGGGRGGGERKGQKFKFCTECKGLVLNMIIPFH